MPEILYRNEEHKFSVYRLCDIPDGVPRSGWKAISDTHFWPRQVPVDASRSYARFRTRAEMQNVGNGTLTDAEVSCAVLDEHAGPLLGLVTSVRLDPIAIPAEDFHREQTRHLGAQHGERNGSPNGWPSSRAAWSAHLRFLVDRSERERRSHAPSVGWDPYGEDCRC